MEIAVDSRESEVNGSSHPDNVVKQLEELSGYGVDYIYGIGVVYMLICVVGLGGNILVFYVILRFSVMRTVTNVFILALALADIAFLVNIPLLVVTSIIGNWPFGNIYCKIYYSVSTINQFASSFFLVTMSADRYLAICWPIWSRRLRTTGAALLICAFVWSLAMSLMYPVFAYSGTQSSNYSDGGETTQCNIFWPGYNATSLVLDGEGVFALYCFILGYALPVILMMFFYGMVLRSIRSSHEKIASTNMVVTTTSASQSIKRRTDKLRRVTTMIFIVILVYIMCWTPYWVFQLFIVLSGDYLESLRPEDGRVVVVVCLILQCFCFANSAINPILYAVLSDNFKQSYSKAFKRSRKCHPAASGGGGGGTANSKSAVNATILIRETNTLRELTGTAATTSQPPLSKTGCTPPRPIQIWLRGDALYQVGSGLLVLL
ncbi:somatostatin receptor type 2-like [Paramacrobiotus metropolitanus]|uniref:somatostatin receptor type 2-like n=1 Tax=Paramacrobiotus metropolitanus TaxID=2943436 RepID=UPI002445E3E5|nr:somatostatin receptor type 2-like [Paramacrobiotus metropolitanus]XP_055349468.1 somatostatin receptor type 2-like [Paramacrobiotus metropolitanus]